MAHVKKSVLVPYSAEQMFSLVEATELYPTFLPWCGGAKVRERSETGVIATIQIDYHGIKHSFTTKNHYEHPHRITITLLDGPFRHLDGVWTFTPLSADACKVELDLHYEFGAGLLERAVGAVFHRIANTFVDAFVRRAEQVYV